MSGCGDAILRMNALGEMPIVNHEADLALRRLAVDDAAHRPSTTAATPQLVYSVKGIKR
jgi:hypothetical protein